MLVYRSPSGEDGNSVVRAFRVKLVAHGASGAKPTYRS